MAAIYTTKMPNMGQWYKSRTIKLNLIGSFIRELYVMFTYVPTKATPGRSYEIKAIIHNADGSIAIEKNEPVKITFFFGSTPLFEREVLAKSGRITLSITIPDQAGEYPVIIQYAGMSDRKIIKAEYLKVTSYKPEDFVLQAGSTNLILPAKSRLELKGHNPNFKVPIK